MCKIRSFQGSLLATLNVHCLPARTLQISINAVIRTLKDATNSTDGCGTHDRVFSPSRSMDMLRFLYFLIYLVCYHVVLLLAGIYRDIL